MDSAVTSMKSTYSDTMRSSFITAKEERGIARSKHLIHVLTLGKEGKAGGGRPTGMSPRILTLYGSFSHPNRYTARVARTTTTTFKKKTNIRKAGKTEEDPM